MWHEPRRRRSWLIFDVRQSKAMYVLPPFFVILAFTAPLRSQEIDGQELMRKASASQQLASILTVEDIPHAWKARKTIETIEDRTIDTYSRGDEKVLEVIWRKRLPRGFSCTLYSAGKKWAALFARQIESQYFLPVIRISPESSRPCVMTDD